MSSIFKRGPEMLGSVILAGDPSRPFRGEDRWDEAYGNMVRYCDPAVEDCPLPLVGPVMMAGQQQKQIGDRVFRAVSEEMESPPNLKCNAAWDPACPRPVPNQTMVPYVPLSYVWNPGVTYSMGHAAGNSKLRPRDRSGRRLV